MEGSFLTMEMMAWVHLLSYLSSVTQLDQQFFRCLCSLTLDSIIGLSFGFSAFNVYSSLIKKLTDSLLKSVPYTVMR